MKTTLPAETTADMNTLENITDETLMEYFKNARATYYGALGHGKAARNESAMNFYADELKRRGIPIPDYKDAKGVFNGDGAV
jgi:hypothetical protein